MEQPPTIPEVSPGPEQPPTMSLPARLLNVFAIPGDVFDEVRSAVASASNWMVPALLFIAVSWVAAWLIFSQASIQQQLRDITAKAIQARIDKANLPPDKAEEMRDIAEKYAGMTQKAGMIVGPVFIAFASPFFWGFIFWLVGTKALKGQFSFMKGVEVAGLANCISVLESIIKTLLIIGLGDLFASPSAALALKNFDPQKPSHSLLAVANIMTIWILGVRSIGLARLSQASFAKAAICVFGIWAAYTGFFIGLGAAIQAAFGR